MQDHELKNLLSETHPVLPGQEERAWTALRDRLSGAQKSKNYWLFFPTWRGLAVGGLALVLLPVAATIILMPTRPLSFATADSKSPGIYATAFYSHSAKAQVVWLNGLEPATDQPTYLDPTTPIPRTPKTSQPAGDLNSL